MNSDAPEIRVDFNARMTKRGFMVFTVTREDLARHGFTIEQALGKPFLLNGGADCDDDGVPAEILCLGTIVRDPTFEFLAEITGDFFWRPTGT